ncbi:MAG: amidoligase family protein [Candidatus Kapabacteria bacterium]|nr:amidoligase family protein [Candidatus Kapabacteria bacterium]
MSTQEILQSNLNKTAKMRMLFELGLTRTEVANLLNVGYGFAQNVYKNWKGTELQILTTPYEFTRKFGIEIEAFGVNKTALTNALRNEGININSESYNHNTRNYWKIVSDGSISGENAFEIVSPPLQGADGLEQLNKVCNVLKRLRAKINKTCGLHIHLDASDLQLNDWKNITYNYAKLENTIDSFMPISRRENNNTYCKSMKRADLETKINNSRTLEQLADTMTNRNRYYKLNFESFWRHRTIEFRQHSGSTEFEKISNWINFVSKLVHFSKTSRVASSEFTELNKFLNSEEQDYFHNRIQDLAS